MAVRVFIFLLPDRVGAPLSPHLHFDTKCCSFAASFRAQWPGPIPEQEPVMKNNVQALALALALAGAGGVALAQQGKPAEGGKTPPSFSERKQNMLARMDERIQ